MINHKTLGLVHNSHGKNESNCYDIKFVLPKLEKLNKLFS